MKQIRVPSIKQKRISVRHTMMKRLMDLLSRVTKELCSMYKQKSSFSGLVVNFIQQPLLWEIMEKEYACTLQ